MKKTQKKLGNKGFSLVELIVVIAIMAVLVGVLAPTLIKNIEKSRESKDAQNLDEVRQAITSVLADEKYYSALSDNTVTIASADGTVSVTEPATAITPTLTTELTDTIGATKVEMTSKKYKNKTITFTISNGKISGPNVAS